MAEAPYLCIGCPGKGDPTIDFDVNGACTTSTADSFKQTRRYRIESPGDYRDNDELAEASARFLRYYDPEEDEEYEREGDERAAKLGIACAERFLAGLCTKSESEIVAESEIDQ